jgi:putative ATP-binding cassette transporter
MSLGLLRFLLRNSRRLMLLMIAAGALSGLFSVGIIALITHALYNAQRAPLYVALGFVLLVAGKIATGVLAQLLLVRFSQGTILDLVLTLSARILQAPLRMIERRGSARILSTLTDDVSSVTWAIECLPRLATNGAVVFGCGLYLAWLSWQMFLWALAVTVVGAGIYRLLHRRAFRVIEASRNTRSRLFDHFRTLTGGAKELMMSRARRDEFLDGELAQAADEFRRHNLAASKLYALADAWVQCLLYVLIGFLLFAYPAFSSTSVETLTGYVFAILYMLSPLWTIIGTLPAVARGQVALDKIEELGVVLDPGLPAPEQEESRAGSGGLAIRLDQVVFAYEDGMDGRAFAVGPLDFELRAGELVFVVGGNGSGKSTFVKVLAGLYPPQRGELRLGETPVTAANRQWYREHFCVLFSDFHLFQKLLGLSGPEIEAAAQRHLELLRIANKVRVRDRAFTSVDLSQGQRKRLALVSAYLEDRPVYIFDEWAADQDPEYKDIFYSRLLPELRSRGKAVVVVTHDDRYFHLGDRVIKLDEGRLVQPDTALRALA